MKVKIGKTTYQVKSESDMSKYPNLAKYDKRHIFVEGPRGAAYWLAQRVDGSWFMMGLGRISPMINRYLRESDPVFEGC